MQSFNDTKKNRDRSRYQSGNADNCWYASVTLSFDERGRGFFFSPPLSSLLTRGYFTIHFCQWFSMRNSSSLLIFVIDRGALCTSIPINQNGSVFMGLVCIFHVFASLECLIIWKIATLLQTLPSQTEVKLSSIKRSPVQTWSFRETIFIICINIMKFRGGILLNATLPEQVSFPIRLDGTSSYDFVGKLRIVT